MAACFKGVPFICTNPTIKLILCEGTTRVLKCRKKMKAGKIMFEFPDCVVCHADSFFLGRPIPILAIHDHLHPGHTYFILPLDRLPGPPDARGGALSAASLSTLGSPNSCSATTSGGNSTPRVRPLPPLVKFSNDTGRGNGDCGDHKSPFEYIKDKDGRVYLIKVVPEFIKMIITNNYGDSMISNSNCTNKYNLICTTPELQKQYEQLVRGKDQAWSPKLETISENHRRMINHSVSFSPSRFMAMEWKKKKIIV